jgi:hypothetical protein
VANTNSHQLAVARLTIMPLSNLALAAKIANEGSDHVRGYDARYLTDLLTIEGEVLHRDRAPSISTPRSAGGGYALASIRVLPWLHPVLKWEQEREQGIARSSATWTTYALAADDATHHVHGQLGWTTKTERPVDVRRNDELVAQLIVIF